MNHELSQLDAQLQEERKFMALLKLKGINHERENISPTPTIKKINKKPKLIDNQNVAVMLPPRVTK